MCKTKSKGREKRSVVCKVCKILKPHTEYGWYKKSSTAKGATTTDINDSSNWILNSITCRSCNSKEGAISQRLKRENPYPRSKKCNCCGKISEYKLHLDHSHGKSKKFRGWLCRNCNQGIGMLGDNIVGIKRALKYLQRVG
jgi:hypothetical protein